MTSVRAEPVEALGGGLDRWLEWLQDLASYRPSDFLMFSPRAYWRLFELHNEAWWPLPVVLPGLGLATLAWWWRSGGSACALRLAGIGLAALAAFTGWAFVHARYAPINWAAEVLAGLWGLLALALLVAAAVAGSMPAPSPRARRWAAALAMWALVAQPLLAPLAGRPLAQAEVFGLAPDPTLIAILAWLLAGAAPSRAIARWALRTAWAMATTCGIAAAATLALLREWQALALATTVAAAVIVVRASRSGPAGLEGQGTPPRAFSRTGRPDRP